MRMFKIVEIIFAVLIFGGECPAGEVAMLNSDSLRYEWSFEGVDTDILVTKRKFHSDILLLNVEKGISIGGSWIFDRSLNDKGGTFKSIEKRHSIDRRLMDVKISLDGDVVCFEFMVTYFIDGDPHDDVFKWKCPLVEWNSILKERFK